MIFDDELGDLIEHQLDPTLLPTALRGDRVAVLNAVKKDGWLLKYAQPDLKNDEVVVRAAIEQESFAYRYVSNTLQRDIHIALAAVQ